MPRGAIGVASKEKEPSSASWANWRGFPSVDGKTHCALNHGTYSICHTSKRPRGTRLQNYRHSKLVKSSSPVCIQIGLITLVS